MEKNRGLRKLLIAGMTREQRIALIRRRDRTYWATDFTSWLDIQLYKLACDVDECIKIERKMNC